MATPEEPPKELPPELRGQVWDFINVFLVGGRSIVHFDGSVWSTHPTPVRSDLATVLVVDRTTAFIGAYDGRILRYCAPPS